MPGTPPLSRKKSRHRMSLSVNVEHPRTAQGRPRDSVDDVLT
ncbi:hypothetical protein STXM2123_5832 [Streptomyces sp. F-3]|nr:hypothetical protein STXM2123_5832 [Streptomyces sp. F-3]